MLLWSTAQEMFTPLAFCSIFYWVTSVALVQLYGCQKKKPWSIWAKESHESTTKGHMTTLKQSTTKLCACGMDCTAYTVYPKKYAHGFVVLCFVVGRQSFIMNSHEVFIHIHQGCFAGTGAIVRLPQCQWSKPDGYGKISECIITTKHSKEKTVCIFVGIYCISWRNHHWMLCCSL